LTLKPGLGHSYLDPSELALADARSPTQWAITDDMRKLPLSFQGAGT
jgi:hypothetical protein